MNDCPEPTKFFLQYHAVELTRLKIAVDRMGDHLAQDDPRTGEPDPQMALIAKGMYKASDLIDVKVQELLKIIANKGGGDDRNELLADYLRLAGKPLSECTLLGLLEWSYRQTQGPDHDSP